MVVLTPVLQKAEKRRFLQDIGGCYKRTIILKKKSVSSRRIPFKCIFVRLEKALMREKNNTKLHWHCISVWSIESRGHILFISHVKSCLMSQYMLLWNKRCFNSFQKALFTLSFISWNLKVASKLDFNRKESCS